MRITADTNILVRAVTGDDPRQTPIAEAELLAAQSVVLPMFALCELVWVLSHGFRHASTDIARALRRIVDGANVVVDRGAVQAGLAMLDAGGDFADGVIAHEGRRLGGEELVSFDARAVALLHAQGRRARLPQG